MDALTLAEAARQLRCSKSHLNRLISGRVPGVPPIPAYYIGRRARRIDPRTLADWMREQEAREIEMHRIAGTWPLEPEHWAGA